MKTDDFEPKELANACEEQIKASNWGKYKSIPAVQRSYEALQEALKEYRENRAPFFFPGGNLEKALNDFLEEVSKAKAQEATRKQKNRETLKLYLKIASVLIAAIGVIIMLV